MKYYRRILLLLFLNLLLHIEMVELQANELLPHRVDYSVSVGKFGQLNGTIPLSILDAGNNFQPQISLDYFSGSDLISVVGKGWRLNTSSRIIRCNKTRWIDGENSAVEFDQNLTFCIDSKRLIRIDEESTEESIVFRHLNENFSKIVLKENTFQLFKKNGEILTYGTNDSTRTYGSEGKIFSWYLAEQIDRAGNIIKYSYKKKDENSPVLSKIEYGGNLTFSVEAYRFIEFEYSERLNPIEKYNSTNYTVESLKIDEIKVSDSDGLAWVYKLNYRDMEFSQGFLLSSIALCVKNKCTPPTNIEYQEEKTSFRPKEVEPTYGVDDTRSSPKLGRYIIDANDDGKPDIITVGREILSIEKGDKTGFENPITFSTMLPASWVLTKDIVFFNDINRDGFQDILTTVTQTSRSVSREETGIYVMYGNSNGFSPAVQVSNKLGSNFNIKSASMVMADLDHDLYPEIILFKSEGVYVLKNEDGKKFTEVGAYGIVSSDFSTRNGWDLFKHVKQVLDINNDGNLDIVGFRPDGIFVSLGKDFTFSKPDKWTEDSSETFYNILNDRRTFADMNSDGLLDIVGMGGDGIFVRLNQGSSFGPDQLWLNDFGSSKGWSGQNAERLIVDINADGMMDYIGIRRGLLRIVIGNGGAVNPQKQNSSTIDVTSSEIDQWRKNFSLFPIDVNFDNVLDLNFINPFRGIVSITSSTGHGKVSKISDGFQKSASIYYDNSSETYRVTSRAEYPHKTIPSAGLVVSKIEKETGASEKRVMQFRYKNLTSDLATKNILGFEFYESEDENFIEKTKFDMRLESLTKGNEIEVVKFLKNEDELTKKSLTSKNWKQHEISENPFHVFTYLSEQTVEYFDDDEVHSHTKKITQRTDPFGNQIFQSTKITSDHETLEEIKTQKFEQENLEDWIIGKVTQKTVVKRNSSGSVLSNTTTYQYDSDGFLIEEIKEPKTSLEQKIVYSRVNNPFGHIDSETITWSKEQSFGLDFEYISSSSRYDQRGFVTETINPEGHSVKIEERSKILRLPVLTVDIDGTRTTKTYSEIGRVKTIDIEGKGITKIDLYLSNANAPKLSKTTSKTRYPNGSFLVEYIDAEDQKIGYEKSTLGGKVVFHERRYDKFGNLIKESIPHFRDDEKKWISYVYDNQQRLVEKINSDGSKKLIERRNNLVVITNERGFSESKVYSYVTGRLNSVENAKNQIISFQYDAQGRQIEASYGNSIKIENEYDNLGRKIKTIDPSFGVVSYAYNTLGKPYSTENNLGSKKLHYYDRIGRLIKREHLENGRLVSVDHWKFDASPESIGKLTRKWNSNSYEEYIYNSKGYLKNKLTSIAGRVFSTELFYDSLSRPSKLKLPSGMELEKEYDAFGIHIRTFNPSTNETFWKLLDITPEGKAEKYTTHEGFKTHKVFDDFGRVTSINLLTSKGKNLNSRSYRYDLNGNLEHRKNNITGHTESFEYDEVDRLIASQGGIESVEYQYDDLGNLISRSDVNGPLEYSNPCQNNRPGPYAITSVGERKYCYNSIGQVIKVNNNEVKYGSYAKPTFIGNDKENVRFIYDADGELLFKSEMSENEELSTYLLSGSELTIKDNKEIWQHKTDGGALIEILNGIITNKLLHTDHIGSIIGVYDSSRHLVEAISYSPWGIRASETDLSKSTTSRGFTGHLHLKSLDLIHMKGRIYDPISGRFLSPDPYIQNPYNLQSYNRYSYLWNNPLSGADPTGYFSIKSIVSGVNDFFKNPQKHLLSAVSMGVTFVGFYFGGPMGAAIANGLFTAAVASIHGASFQDSLKIGIITGVLTYYSATSFETFSKGFQTENLLSTAYSKIVNKQKEDFVIKPVMEHISKKTGLSREEINVVLIAFSESANLGENGSRYHAKGSVYNKEMFNHNTILGVSTRGAAYLFHDVADIVLGLQGVLDATGREIRDNNLPFERAHSLGTITAANLLSQGYDPGQSSVDLYAVPIGIGAPKNARVHMNGKDPITAFGLNFIFNPHAEDLNYDGKGIVHSWRYAYPEASLAREI